MTLYEIEDNLLALHNSIELIESGEMAESERDMLLGQALAEMQEASSAGRAKRDAIAKYLRSLAAHEGALGAEIAFLTRRKQQLARQRAGIEEYVLRMIREYAPEPRSGGESKKLEGNLFTLRARQNPESVQVTGDGEIPMHYQRFEIRGLDESLFRIMMDALKKEAVRATFSVHSEPDKAKIKDAIHAGVLVQGAQLGRTERLEVK